MNSRFFNHPETLARLIRLHALEMCYASKASHIGGMFSVADILALLYAEILRVSPQSAEDPSRDRLVLSKGHAAAALYATLAECGFLPLGELLDFRKNGSRLSGHVYSRVAGVEFSTGSLGQGIGVACGMALAARLDKSGSRAYAIVGDGECDEGSVWECARFAAENELGNFTVIVDDNRMKGGELYTPKVDPFKAWSGFGWNAIAVDGHDFDALREAFAQARESAKPSVIVARTIKGKGVSFMQNEALWHYRNPDAEVFARAWRELGGTDADLLNADNKPKETV
ncbi:transketolase, N-terminal subunit [Campylobacterota bacterium]|nr:transketolase, N-terminal subunit [Campylobacterota bacterium]